MLVDQGYFFVPECRGCMIVQEVSKEIEKKSLLIDKYLRQVFAILSQIHTNLHNYQIVESLFPNTNFALATKLTTNNAINFLLLITGR